MPEVAAEVFGRAAQLLVTPSRVTNWVSVSFMVVRHTSARGLIGVRSADPYRYLLHEGSPMPRVVITHAVEDIDRWLQGKAERAAAIESGTGSNVTDFVAHDGSTNIAVTADVADLAAMQSMLASPSPDVLAAMEAHGVVQPITAYVEA